ncbi:MAG: response regulator [Alphaproteobacteria bacterium]
MLQSEKLNLERIQFLVVDDNIHSRDITTAVVTGFGARHVLKSESAKKARDLVCSNIIDVLLIAGRMPDEDGYSFVRWMRRQAPEANRFIPVIVLSAHTRRSQVFEARDCGVHAIIAKPLVPKTLLERTVWMAKDKRMFIESDNYIGPDRRFKNLGPPEGMIEQRSDALALDD